MNAPTLLALALSAPVVLLSVAGCARKTGEAPGATPPSSVEIVPPSGGQSPCVVRTKAAEFQVLGGRSAKALLLADGTKLTIQAEQMRTTRKQRSPMETR